MTDADTRNESPTQATAAQTTSGGALGEIRVLELGTLIAGPFAGRLLGDMGADVIKIEDPKRPDPLRTWGQGERDGHRFFWTVHARNKRCITLDLRSSDGQDLFRRLVAESDVIVENFRPGTLERWGLGYDVLSEVNPGIVLARVSGYGQTGPKATHAGYASVAEAESGLRHLNGYPGQAPPRLALSLGDTLGGMFAVQGVLAALLSRERTGRGQIVDVALTEACLAVQESVIPDYDAAGVVRGPSGTRLEGIAPSNLYRTSDDMWIVIAANQDTVFRRLCTAMDRPELADDVRFADHLARGVNQDELDDLIGAWAAKWPLTELLEHLSASGVVAGPVNTVAEVVADEQFQSREMLVPHRDERTGDDVLGPGVVPRLTGTPGSVRRAGPPIAGYDNAAVYGELLGVTDGERAELRERGII
ncbi:formyl-CoA transferase [Rhodococcus sp. SMB37]|nr:formyl-CoA transferase [Rhodococcus sp. SMB37]